MNRDIKTLIILTPGFARDESDTACLPFLQNFVRELNDLYPLLKILLLAFDYPFTNTGYKWNDNRVIPFNGWGRGKVKRLYKWLRIWMRMKKIERGGEVLGILSLWCNECAYLGNRFAKRNNLLHFCWIQGQDAKKENKYIRRIKPSSDELIALSDFIQEEFNKNHNIRPAHVIPVGIRPAELPWKLVVRDIDISGVGSLIPLKQYDLFINVISRVRQHFPDIKVVLCGKGPEESNLKKLIGKHGLRGNISLTGELPHSEILKTMSRSRIFLHTSNYEGMGVVCLEALYAGCHVISFVKPMLDEIENWYIVQTKEEMEERVLTILSDPGIHHNSVLTFTIRDSAVKIMQLFNYKEAMSS